MTAAEANALLVDYLVHCCLYYEFSASIITDHQFDRLAYRLYEAREFVTNPHKNLIAFDHLKTCPSGYYIQYPGIIRDVAARVVRGELTLRPQP